jgi:hypothetical protein
MTPHHLLFRMSKGELGWTARYASSCNSYDTGIG